jgi:hypothetical protein
MMQTDDESVRAFLAHKPSWPNNAWCVEGPFDVYVRKARRSIAGVSRSMLDISNLKTRNPGTGKLGTLFDHLEALAAEFHYDAVFAENVLNEWMRPWLLRRGYSKVANSADIEDHAPSYWKWL